MDIRGCRGTYRTHLLGPMKLELKQVQEIRATATKAKVTVAAAAVNLRPNDALERKHTPP